MVPGKMIPLVQRPFHGCGHGTDWLTVVQFSKSLYPLGIYFTSVMSLGQQVV